MKNTAINIALITGIMLFSGCASKQPSCGIYNKIENFNKANTEKAIKARLDSKPYQLKIKPIVETRQNDAKVVVNMGKILKVWIAPYKIKGTLIAGHDIYTWVQKPDFIVGETISDPRDKKGLVTPIGSFPFIFRDSEIDAENGKINNKTLRNYVNNVYKAEKDNGLIIKKNNEAEKKFDSVIKEYLKKDSE